MGDTNDSADSAELEALFDSIVAAEGVAAKPAAPPAGTSEDMFSRIGQLTRRLYDTLRELGYDRALEKVVQTDIPDARDRLNYVAAAAQQAAERTLTAAERAQSVQETLGLRNQELAQRWDRLFDNRLSVEEFRQLAHETRDHLNGAAGQFKVLNDRLVEIILAQEFQDLTGQVIGKTIAMAHRMEQELLQLLIAATPPEKRAELEAGLLSGPVVNTAGRTDIVTSQAQVDELLDSLGF